MKFQWFLPERTIILKSDTRNIIIIYSQLSHTSLFIFIFFLSMQQHYQDTCCWVRCHAYCFSIIRSRRSRCTYAATGDGVISRSPHRRGPLPGGQRGRGHVTPTEVMSRVGTITVFKPQPLTYILF